MAFLEETFGFRVEDEEMIPENLDSLDKLVDYVQTKLAEEVPGSSTKYVGPYAS